MQRETTVDDTAEARRAPLLNDPKVRGIVYQVAALRG